MQALANWGARRGGTLGKIALNAAAGANVGLEASGINAAASTGDAIANGRTGEALLGIAFLAVPEGSGLAKGITKTIARAQGAEVAFSQLGKFTRAVWEVAGEKGAGYVRWNRVLNEEGSTIRLFKDVYNQGGKWLRRDWYVGGPPK